MSILLNFILDVMVFFCIYLIFSLSLNFQQGYAGISNLGLYLPIIIGAMAVGYLPGRLAMKIYGLDNTELDFVQNNAIVINSLKTQLQNDPLTSIFLLVITLLLAMAIGAVVGYLCAYPALRLPTTYLAVFFLSLGESLRVIGMQTSVIAGGTMGVNTINPFWWLGSNAFLGSVFFIFSLTFLVFLVFHVMGNSPLGRALKAMRENELTAASVGKNVPVIKKKVLAFSFSILALGGALHSFNMGAAIIGGYTRADFSFWPWLMMIVGGTGNHLGVFSGTLALVLMRRAMITFKSYFTFLPFNVLWLEPLLLGTMLALIIAFRPEGLLREQPSRIKKENILH